MTPVPLDLTLLDLCQAAYDGPNPTYAAGDCRIYRTDLPNCTALVAAGSRTLEDWVTDLKAGWRADASAVLPLVLAVVPFPKPLALAGHSKGGSDIQDLAARLIEAGAPVWRLTTFEAPAVGPRDGYLEDVDGADYAHYGDEIVWLPPSTPHPRALLWFPEPALPIIDPHRDLVIDPFANHHILTAIRPALVRLLGV